MSYHSGLISWSYICIYIYITVQTHEYLLMVRVFLIINNHFLLVLVIHSLNLDSVHILFFGDIFMYKVTHNCGCLFSTWKNPHSKCTSYPFFIRLISFLINLNILILWLFGHKIWILSKVQYDSISEKLPFLFFTCFVRRYIIFIYKN